MSKAITTVGRNDDGTINIHPNNLTEDQAGILKCYLEMNLEEGGSIDELGFEGPENDDAYDAWYEEIFHPIEELREQLENMV